MHAEYIDAEKEAVDHSKAWLTHRLEAVKKFLKNAVVIDNEPLLRETIEAAAHEATDEPLQLPDDGMGGGVFYGSLKIPEANEVEIVSLAGDHWLDVRAVSDAFVDAGIACAFVLPDNNVAEDEAKVGRALAAAKISDIVVIDWYLKPQSSSLTLQILEQLARSDVDESGRMRLICVYTGQTITDTIFSDMKSALKNGGIALGDMADKTFYAKNGHCLVMALNKSEVSPRELPVVLVEAFADLADGLIPAFSLAAVGAIRKNIHHMVTRFDKNLDSSYIANRLITNPPGDVAEMMRELLVAECDNALGLESVADEFLDIPAIEKWLAHHRGSFCVSEYDLRNKDKVKIDYDTLLGILNNGVTDREMIVGDKDVRDFPEFRRNKITEALAGSVAKAMSAENDFSRLVAFRREAFGSTKLASDDGWSPSLTTGTVLKLGEGASARFFMCLTPACDMLRLKEPRNFVFLEGLAQDKPYNFVVKDSNGEAISLFFDKKSPSLSTFVFSPDEAVQRVRGVKAKEGASFLFFSVLGADSVEFLWLGEIRYGRAASEMSGLASNWMRIGILDSEYLRISAKGHFKFGA